MEWWGWIIIGVVFLGAELFLSTDFYLVFFGFVAMALGVAVLLGLSLPFWAELLIFAVASVVLLVLFRRRVRGRFLQPDADVGDSLVGKTVDALSEIPSDAAGQVSYRGTKWKAHNVGAEPIASGTHCQVERVEGVTLFVRSR